VISRQEKKRAFRYPRYGWELTSYVPVKAYPSRRYTNHKVDTAGKSTPDTPVYRVRLFFPRREVETRRSYKNGKAWQGMQQVLMCKTHLSILICPFLRRGRYYLLATRRVTRMTYQLFPT